MIYFLCTLAIVRGLAVLFHELAHAGAARCLGFSSSITCAASGSHTDVAGVAHSGVCALVIRHTGWIFSVVTFALAMVYLQLDFATLFGLGWTAFDAMASDLLQLGVAQGSSGERFFCGNFGLVLLESAHASKVKSLLEKMIRVTMMRGAQSAGLVTYESTGENAQRGVRRRVVNGKRTDLCSLLLRQYECLLQPARMSAPCLYQGHTRFATSSIAGMAGCHPHQWCPPKRVAVWTASPSTGAWACTKTPYEGYITHNGDLDFFSMHGITYPLEQMQILLPAFLHAKLPATVDSACVAGLLDLLRAAGMWHAAVRYGYVFGALSEAGDLAVMHAHAEISSNSLWSSEDLANAAAYFESEWSSIVAAPAATIGTRTRYAPEDPSGDVEAGTSSTRPTAKREQMISLMLKKAHGKDVPLSIARLSASGIEQLVRASVAAFFDQDLLAAARQLLKNAVGSFGLVLSTSIDSKRELVVASRGQTMSIAFYPKLGAFLFASEAAATKAGLGATDGNSTDGPRAAKSPKVAPLTPDKKKWSSARKLVLTREGLDDGFRLDLDDVNGEVVLLRWGATEQGAPQVASAKPRKSHFGEQVPMTSLMAFADGGQTLWGATYCEGKFGSMKPLMRRMLRLGGNPLVLPIPKLGGADPVGKELADLPSIMRRIHDDWNRPSESLNRLSALTLQQRLRKRMLAHEKGTHDGSIDLLIAGCEVSLWLGEQFAADMHRAFPKLRIVCLSANKLLAQLGQGFAAPQTGFSFHEGSYDLSESCVLLISQSGGTFATLNASNLLKGFTSSIFVVTSEWDTQVARAVRAGKPGQGATHSWQMASFVFTNFCGCRPAEPCSLTVAATHQVLTQILLYLMYAVRHYEPGLPRIAGSSFHIEEVRELETLNRNTLDALERLATPGNETRASLLKQGDAWARHVLEGPIAWILSAVYILLTVVSGFTPLSLAALGVCYAFSGTWGWGALFEVDAHLDPIKYAVGLVDAVIYAFLPWWITVVLRVVQGRPWHHRVAGRSLLVGDIPWVAQSIEAYVSKLFALSYSIASLGVASGNPADHLVHRHTHRVVRGGLLAVGRPDGRLNALSSTESTVCLSVCQASSIQNMGVTLESYTLGHNPYKLGLSAAATFLPTTRPQFISEYLLGGKLARGSTSSAIMGLLDSVKGTGASERARSETATEMSSSGRSSHFVAIEPLPCARCVGEWMLQDDKLKNENNAALMQKQVLVQTLYEGRFASLERFVGFLILFHRLGKRVQDFWPSVSCGMLGYDMSRSHSIMRIATTASPVSGSEVRFKMLELAEETRTLWAARIIQIMYRILKKNKTMSELAQLRQLHAVVAESAAKTTKIRSSKEVVSEAAAWKASLEDLENERRRLDEAQATNGHANGYANGHTNGHANGLANGEGLGGSPLANGHANGHAS